MPDSPFTARHLKPDELRELYRQALAQTEGAVANSWLNFVLTESPVTRAAYEDAAAKLARIEADLKRLTEPVA